MTGWLMSKLARWLLGPAAVDGVTDERMDGLHLAMEEQFAQIMAQDA